MSDPDNRFRRQKTMGGKYMLILELFEVPRITNIKTIIDGPDIEMLATRFILKREVIFTVNDPLKPSKAVIIEEMGHVGKEGNSFVIQGVFTDSGQKFAGFYFVENKVRGGHLMW